MDMKKILVVIMICAMIPQVFAAAYSSTVSTTSPMVELKNAQFLVKTLQYDPYPVNPGDWFDVWVKVENIGQPDAENSEFTVDLTYPFDEVEGDIVQDYGTIPGTINAHEHVKPGEEEPQENYVVVKYRVHVDENAQEGTYDLKFTSTTSSNQGAQSVTKIPIDVQNTKTDFSIAEEYASESTGTFTIVNIGENTADGITVTIENTQGVEYTAIIGSLDVGDFTTFTLPLTGIEFSNDPIAMQLSYTDTSGVRSTTTEEVIISQTIIGEPAYSGLNVSSYVSVLNLSLGAILGVIITGASYWILTKRK